MRAIWRVRSRSMASVGAVHVRARAIAFPRRVEEPLRPSPPAPPLGTCCKAQETVVEGEALLIPSPLPRSSRARSRGAPVRPREPSPAAQRGRARRGPTTPPAGAFPATVAAPWRDTKVLKPAYPMCDIGSLARGRLRPPSTPSFKHHCRDSGRAWAPLPELRRAPRRPPTRHGRRPRPRPPETPPGETRLRRQTVARASFGIEGAEPLASPFVGTKGMLALDP